MLLKNSAICNNLFERSKTMATRKENYYITEAAQERFRKYLFDEKISFAAFCRRAGVKRQYLELVYKGKNPITEKAREYFKKGGYELI